MSEPDDRQGVLLTVAYDGTPFAGFTPQAGQRTVASELLRALQHFDPSIDKLRVASRTDSGVHAWGQRVAFSTAASLPPRGWVLGAARYLPDSVSITAAARVPAPYNPRFDAQSKTYRYLVLCRATRDPHLAKRAWRIDGPPARDALEVMRLELAAAHGTHDFAAFRSAKDQRDKTTRTITATGVRQQSEHSDLLALDITGNGFLYHMVRILVGTAVDVARRRLAPGALARALQSGDRRDGGMTAPPDGLYLREVVLSTEGEDRWPAAT